MNQTTNVDNIKEAMLHLEKNLCDEVVARNYRCVISEGRKTRSSTSQGNQASEHGAISAGRKQRPCTSTGGFCIAFKLERKDSRKKICYRIWHQSPKEDMGKRYELISRALEKISLPYFVPFVYVNEALKVDDTILPGCRMDWVEGKNLYDYIIGATPSQLESLPKKFMDMCVSLRKHGISHGDLSCKNILIDAKDEIKLVDYDSLYVPEMQDRFLQVTAGIVNFQHPQRSVPLKELKVSLEDDNFSQQVIYLSLLALVCKPSLIEFCDAQEMFFVQADYEDGKIFEQSENYRIISEIDNEKVKFYLEELKKSISLPLDKVRSIVDIESEYQKQKAAQSVRDSSDPVRKLGRFCINCGYEFSRNTEKYCPRCGKERTFYLS